MRYFLALALMLAAALPAAAKPTAVQVLQSWTGQMPPGVPPLFQASVASANDLQRVWTMCQVKGAPPKVDFEKRFVLVAVRNGSAVKFGTLTLDDGTLKTNVIITPDNAKRQACALALVNRAGVKTVNGVQVGQ